MRIGIDARFYGPESKGLGRYTQKLIEYLVKNDSENEYIIFLRRDNFDLFTPDSKNFKKVLADYRWYSFAEQIFFPWKLYASKCDVIHFMHFNVPVLYFGKMVITIHDLILLHFPTKKATTRNALFYWIKYFAYRLVIWCAIIRAKKIIAVSHFTKKDICSHFSSSVCNKVEVIHEAAEVSHFDVSLCENVKDKYGIMGAYMLYVGNAYPHKNLYNLVDAYALFSQESDLHKTSLVLVGKNDYFYEKIEQHIKEKEIQNVHILHTVSDEDLSCLYNESTFFVFPSLYEGFGLPPLEAQMYGVPVLSSDHACMREVLSDEGALYFDGKNINAIVRSMRDIFGSDEIRNTLIQNGRENVQRYSWDKMAKKIHKIYTSF